MQAAHSAANATSAIVSSVAATRPTNDAWEELDEHAHAIANAASAIVSPGTIACATLDKANVLGAPIGGNLQHDLADPSAHPTCSTVSTASLAGTTLDKKTVRAAVYDCGGHLDDRHIYFAPLFAALA
jgi:hypothetical protein